MRRTTAALICILILAAISPAPAMAWDGATWADYTAFMSPITAEVKATCRAIMATGQQQGRVEGRMGQFGDSITYSMAYFRNIVSFGPQDNETGHDYAPVLSWLAYSGDKPADDQSFYVDHGKGNEYACYSGWETLHFGRFNQPATAIETGNGATPGNFSWALIMIGTNDVNHSTFRAENYRPQYRQIIQDCIDRGVIPVLSTIPPRDGEMSNGHVDQCNAEVLGLVEEFGIPWVDYYGLIMHYQPQNWHGTLIKDDGVHPSSTTGGNSFSQEALTTTDGYSARTKLTLDMAEKIQRIVFEDGAPESPTPTKESSSGRLKAGYR